MATAQKRITNPSRPCENPRSANAALLLANLAALEAAGQHAIVELRGFGLHKLADSLLDQVEKVRVIHAAAGVRVQEASHAE
jgi:hypothetical protein